MANELNTAPNGLNVTFEAELTTKDVAYEVTLHARCRRLLVELRTNDGSWSWTGAKGVDLGNASHQITADKLTEILVPMGSSTLYLQADDNTTAVSLTPLSE
jgi:hypothetical protein